jgi:hypothetical protein
MIIVVFANVLYCTELILVNVSRIVNRKHLAGLSAEIKQGKLMVENHKQTYEFQLLVNQSLHKTFSQNTKNYPLFF